MPVDSLRRIIKSHFYEYGYKDIGFCDGDGNFIVGIDYNQDSKFPYNVQYMQADRTYTSSQHYDRDEAINLFITIISAIDTCIYISNRKYESLRCLYTHKSNLFHMKCPCEYDNNSSSLFSQFTCKMENTSIIDSLIIVGHYFKLHTIAYLPLCKCVSNEFKTDMCYLSQLFRYIKYYIKLIKNEPNAM